MRYTETTRSADGTIIAYDRIGGGPQLVVGWSCSTARTTALRLM